VISLIVACGDNRVIGNDENFPWVMPGYYNYIDHLTKGKIVLMGRRTYDLMGEPIPDRKNIVMSRTAFPKKPYLFRSSDNTLVVQSLDELMRLTKGREVYVIGGGELYKKFINVADRIYMVQVHSDRPGDTFFPEMDYDEWYECETLPMQPLGDEFPSTLRILDRL
jgi:dihydrofolate reductase